MLKVIRLAYESLNFAIRAVVVNRLRTLLSLLGITIGIFAIISVFTIFDSLEKNIRESISSLGSDVIYIQKWPWTEESGREYKWWQYLNRPVPTIPEYEELKRRSTTAEYFCFVISPQSAVQYEKKQIDDISIMGVSEGFEKIRSFDIEKGRYFSDFEMKSGRNYAILGSKVANELFGEINPLEKTITIRGIKVKVLGVMETEGQNNFGNTMDESLILNINFVRNLVNIRGESMGSTIWVKGKPEINNEALYDEMRMLMRSIRRLKPEEADNFALNRTSMLNNQLEAIFGTLNIAGWIIGVFSLLVGGFGIANIMFVSVKERTNLIGIQKALGAKRYFILLQFIFESIALAIAGGIIGLLLVFGGALIMVHALDFSVSLSLGNIILGISISSAIGLISGFAPAWQAARLNPVEAINTSF
jgi:putative ABC transport system permease protein